MSGHFTRKMYDGCAFNQDLKQSTDPLSLIMDVNKYVNCNNACKSPEQRMDSAASLVDVESSLWGIDKTSSRCDTTKHPFCGQSGCLLTNDSRLANSTPYLCERGGMGDNNAVVTTNMQMPTHPGFNLPSSQICGNRVQNNTFLPPLRNQQTQLPIKQSAQPTLPQRMQYGVPQRQPVQVQQQQRVQVNQPQLARCGVNQPGQRTMNVL